jgi:hypothetical protein
VELSFNLTYSGVDCNYIRQRRKFLSEKNFQVQLQHNIYNIEPIKKKAILKGDGAQHNDTRLNDSQEKTLGRMGLTEHIIHIVLHLFNYANCLYTICHHVKVVYNVK